MATNDDECKQHVLAASMAENAGIDLDRDGNVTAAIQKYEECEQELAKAIATAMPNHADDHPKLVQHRQEVIDRINHLKEVSRGKPAVPVEDHIKAVQLGMQATQAASSAIGVAGGVKTLGAVAVMGAGAGLLVLGSTVGLAAGAIGGAAGAAYCATRQDKVGDAARSAGGVAVNAAGKAKEINEKHQITDQIKDTGSKAFCAAKDADSKYGVSKTISDGVGAFFRRASELEQKHKITDKVAGGFSAGLGRIQSTLDKKGSTGSAGTAPS